MSTTPPHLAQTWAFRTAVVGFLAASAAVVLLALFARDQTEALRAEAQETTRARAVEIAEEISDRLEAIGPMVDDLAITVSGTAASGTDLDATLQQVFEAGQAAELGLLEVGVAFRPADADVTALPVSPHYGLANGTTGPFPLTYDYTERDWYQSGLADGAHWTEPYFGDTTQQWTAGYVRSFSRESGRATPTGVARINFNLAAIRALVATHNVGQTGYAVLFSQDHRVIAHPIERYQGAFLEDLRETDGLIDALVTDLETDRTGDQIQEVTDASTGQEYWVHTEAVGQTAWSVSVVFNQLEVFRSAERDAAFRDLQIAIVIIALSFLTVLLTRSYQGTDSGLWHLAVWSSAVFLVGTAAIWSVAVTSPPVHRALDLVQLDEATSEASLAAHLAATAPDADPVRVPTGVFVQSVRFTGANNVLLTGYIWQTVEPGSGLDGPPGVIMPEAEASAIEETYRSEDGRTTGWYFEATLRQPFNYTKFPFDREDVWIRLWPGDLRGFGRRVVLVPDFGAYSVNRPELRPGLEQDFVLEGWDIQTSYFSFRRNTYNVDFGLDADGPGQGALELYFNIGLRRNFIGPFVSDMIPLSIVAFLLFAVLIISTRELSKIELAGFSCSAVLAYCAALFFVLMVGHVHLRETLATPGIIYLEYFYFVMYFAILAVSANSLLLASPVSIPIVDYRDNLVVKLAFWPALTASLFVVTLVTFS
jgi:hypothetical protein